MNHYYSHNYISAYDALFYLKARIVPTTSVLDDYILDICNYIQWHMRMFDLETIKAEKKFINIVGQEFYDNLMILHEADIYAH